MKRKLTSIAIILAAGFFFAPKANAQDTIARAGIDSLGKEINKIGDELKSLKKLKITGYMQGQYQWADSTGIASYAGGDFKGVKERFAVRRGRIKFAYENGLTQYVLQLDVTEGGVSTKNAYFKMTDPWTKAISLTAGIFDRPFGYEIGYSSSNRETPERGRMSQIIFPGERDLGAMLTFQMPKTSALNFLKLDLAMVNGAGIASDYDTRKDFIGHLGMTKSTANEKISYGGGVSFYNGFVSQNNKYLFNMQTDAAGLKKFAVDSSATNKGAYALRQYMGADAQLTVDLPFIGLTTIRGEYIQGQQPGGSSTSKSASAVPANDPTKTYTYITDTKSTYVRNFSGAYFYFVKDIPKTPVQLVAKYDWYDPNVKASGNEIGAKGSNLTAADLKYTTLGLGLNYRWNGNIKISAYYDMVKNETSANVKGYEKDLKDNVITLRVQYKF